ncbi:hypothetical protein ACS0TY_010156 [Phlomoides rotata]
MVHTLQDIRGGGGSIKLGTTGTISALMSREIEVKESALKVVPSLSTLASVSAGDEACKTLKSGTPAGEASSSSSSSSVKNHICPETPRRKQDTPRSPMLKSDDITVDGTPTTKKHVKKHSCVVDIMDIKCGNPNKIWVNPVKHRLKKLGFSKLSDSVA